jgi:predicted SnoaL-like aldol condensation-catalyzing enzyme
MVRHIKLLVTAIIVVTCRATGYAATRDQTEFNKRIVVNFYTKAFVEHKPREAAETYISEQTYIQHNPNVKNGRKAFIEFFEPYFSKQSNKRSSRIKRVMAEDNLVALHVESLGSQGEPSFAVVDIFRVMDGKIVEHWDVMQQVAEKTANGNTMF